MMAGPTTEVLDEDIKELKAEIRDMRVSLGGEVQRSAVSLAELRGEFRLAKVFIGLTLVATLSGLGAGIWWAATITANVHNFEVSTGEKFKALEVSTGEKFKALDDRIDRLEALITKVVEQTKPKS
jgi:prefoldin subunit 5